MVSQSVSFWCVFISMGVETSIQLAAQSGGQSPGLEVA